MLVDPGWPQVADTADCRPKQLKLERAATATKISFDDTMDTGDRHRGRHTTHRAILTFQNIFFIRGNSKFYNFVKYVFCGEFSLSPIIHLGGCVV